MINIVGQCVGYKNLTMTCHTTSFLYTSVPHTVSLSMHWSFLIFFQHRHLRATQAIMSVGDRARSRAINLQSRWQEVEPERLHDIFVDTSQNLRSFLCGKSHCELWKQSNCVTWRLALLFYVVLRGSLWCSSYAAAALSFFAFSLSISSLLRTASSPIPLTPLTRWRSSYISLLFKMRATIESALTWEYGCEDISL